MTNEIEWFKASERLPIDGQECLLMPPDRGGLSTIPVYGPIMWSEKNKMWLDVFRDPEGGSAVSPDLVDVWTDWARIAPPTE